MAYKPNAIIRGAARVYAAPYVANSVASLPPVNHSAGTDWSAPWVDLGLTQGVSFQIGIETYESEADQIKALLDVIKTRESLQCQITLKQTNAANLKYALGRGTLSALGTTGTKLEGKHSDELDSYTLGIQFGSPDPSNTAISALRLNRVKVTDISEVEPSREADNQIQVTFTALASTLGTDDKMWELQEYRPGGAI